MRHWLGELWTAWRFGAGLLLLVAVALGASFVAGGILLSLLSWLFGYETSSTDWFIVTALLAPFPLAAVRRVISRDDSRDRPSLAPHVS